MGSYDAIADQVIKDLNLNERVSTANLPSFELEIVEKVLERYIADRLKDIDCYAINDQKSESPEAIEIVQKVWDRLKETHRLRVVK